MTCKQKYMTLDDASMLKRKSDRQKYELACELHKLIHDIRHQYREDWESKERTIQQRGVALYFIDKVCLSVSLPVCLLENYCKDCSSKEVKIRQ